MDYISDGYSMDQTEHSAALKPIARSELTGLSCIAIAPKWAAQRYLSLVMALAYNLKTRPDLALRMLGDAWAGDISRLIVLPPGIFAPRNRPAASP